MDDIDKDRNWIKSIVAESIPRKFDGTIVEFFHNKLKLPQSVRYPVYIKDESPWLIAPLEALGSASIRRVDVRGPAGSAKSLIGEIHIAWAIAQDPGMYYYVHQTDPDGADALEDRVMPMIRANDFLAHRLPNDRHKQRIAKIAFPHMPLYVVGANLSAAQSKRVRYLTMEEPHMWKPGMQTAFEKRCEGSKNPKILTLSTGGIVGDESDMAFNRGSCEEWHVPCPHCDTMQIMGDDPERLIFDRNDETIAADGSYVWSKILPTVRYNCAACNKDWPKDTASRRQQSLKGEYRSANTGAPSDHRSFHIEAPAIHYFDLGAILMEKLTSSYSAAAGQLQPLRDYIQKRRALAWNDAPIDDENKQSAERMKGQYFMAEHHDGEIARFMTIDNQAGRASRGEGAHRWVLVRSFSAEESRLVYAGKATTWEEVEELRIKHNVEPRRTLVDMAFDRVAVQHVIARYGWFGLSGEATGKEFFPHREIINGQTIVRKLPYSPIQAGYTGLGTTGGRKQALYFEWCGQAIKNIYHRMKNGMTSYKWTSAQDSPSDYSRHLVAEFKKQIITKAGTKKWEWVTRKGADNHLLDCDQMCLVAAMLDPRLRDYLFAVSSNHTDQEQDPHDECAIKP